MKHPLIPVFVLCGTLAPFLSTSAATLIQTKAGPQQTPQSVLLDGKHVRIGEPEQKQGYMLMLLEQNKRYMINTKQKQIIEMPVSPPQAPDNMPKAPPEMPGMPKAPVIKSQLEHKGSGPKIAGYATEHYQITANGKICGSEYVSAEATKLAHVADFMKNLLASSGKPALPFLQQMPPCVQARMSVNDELMQHGLSMRSVDASGAVSNEVVSIDTNAKVEAGAFDLPAGYQQTNMQEMLRNAMQGMQNGKPGAHPHPAMPPH